MTHKEAAQAAHAADLRRPSVPHEPVRLPRRGTPQRAELARRAAALRDAGATYLQIANELQVHDGSVAMLLQEGRHHE